MTLLIVIAGVVWCWFAVNMLGVCWLASRATRLMDRMGHERVIYVPVAPERHQVVTVVC